MSGTPKYDPKVTTPPAQPMKKSTFVTSLEIQRQERISSIQPSKRQLSFSSYLDFHPQQTRANFHKPYLRNDNTDKMPETEDELKRAKSAKGSVLHKPSMETVERSSGDQLNQNVIRLKIEEMTFKYKLKISNLLKQLSIPSHEMNRFHNIVRIDDILNFLSEKVRDKIVNSQINEANFNQTRSRQKQTLNQYEIERDSLSKRLKDKQTSQKALKAKVKQLHIENQQYLDKLNLKEKDLSSKMTEIYQLKANLKESEKSFENMKNRLSLLEKEAHGYRDLLQSESKDIITVNTDLREQNIELKEKTLEVEEELNSLRDKQTAMTEMNTQLTQEVARWRQRFDDGSFGDSETKKSSDEHQTEIMPTSNKDMRKSTMSMSMSMNMNMLRHHGRSNTVMPTNTNLQIENMRLTSKVEDLTRKHKQLQRDLLNYATVKSKYEQTLANTGQHKVNLTEGLDRNNNTNRDSAEIQAHYKSKIEGIADEWKNKLYEIVHKYEDELQQTQQKLNDVTAEKDQLEKRIKQQAVDKYDLENKVLGHEKEIYELLKMYKSTNRRYQDSVRQSQASINSESKSRKSSFAEIKEQKGQCQNEGPSEQLQPPTEEQKS